MSALEALRADVEQVIADHYPQMTNPVGCGWPCICEWGESGDKPTLEAHAAHVSERVMAMLAEKWGLRESHSEHVSRATGERVVTHETRLVTDWRPRTEREDGDAEDSNPVRA